LKKKAKKKDMESGT